MSQSIASRSKRPQHTEPDDVVMARALETADWLKRNSTLVAVIVVALIVVIGGLLYFRADRNSRAEEAAIAFLPVEQAVLSGEEQTSLQQLQAFIQRHGDTTYGDEARVLMAQVHLRAGRTEEAIDAASPVAADLSGPIGAQAALLVGAAQEAAGQNDAALETYLRIGRDADEKFRRDEGLSHAAVLAAEAGNVQQAADLYQQLIDGNEDSPQRSLYEMRLAEVEARLATQ